jgi:hypothetical protein
VSLLVHSEEASAQPLPVAIAYEVPAGTAGNQGNFFGSLGMDFDVQLDIVVLRLGVFDSGSDGLMLPISARLYDRDTFAEVAGLEFTPAEPGDLAGGSRFKPLAAPLELPAGFRGTIAASGYGGAEPNGNRGAGPLGLTTNDGGCSLDFVGTGRFGDPGVFPASSDQGPPQRYAAGTFEFQPQEALTPRDAIAYLVPANTVGNQDFGGALGMDFNVNAAIRITRLGVFDSGSDGLMLPLSARLFNRDTQGPLTDPMLFTPGDPGDLLDGSRFKELEPPLELSPGFRGSIVAEGYGAAEPNGNAPAGGLPWTTDSGGCAISFTGSGRWGDAGTYPPNDDAGPANRYAAGTFEFEIDESPPAPPPAPPLNLAVVPGDGRVDLSWDASAGMTPAATYRVFRGPSPGGAFVQVAEVAVTAYADTGLPNDVPVCYFVRAVSAMGVESFDSARRCAVPSAPQPPGRTIAYRVPAFTAGNQVFGGALGMDFDVDADIRVTRLGVFDDLSDGLNVPLGARIYNRDDMLELASVEFLPEDPGVLIDGSRFKSLAAPLDLPAGFRGVIAASGYSGSERNGNQGVGPVAGLTTDDGGCRVSYIGAGRFGDAPGAFPATVDGGPANRYAAGTFEFEALGPPVGMQPAPPPGLEADFARQSVTLRWIAPAASNCILPAASYRVRRSAAGGAFVEVAQVTETIYTDLSVPQGADVCYTVRSVAAGGAESGDSIPVCGRAGRFIAYEVPFGTVGNQVDQLAVGMDFNVQLDIAVKRLGAFDSASAGLNRTLTVRLYDRDGKLEVAAMTFTPEDPGTLLNGSRFKELAQPLELAAGFRGSIVAEGYGDGEPNGAGGAWSTNSGPCSLFFVGHGRSGVGGAILPLPNPLGRPDEYAAGTFEFEPTELATPRDAIAYVVPQGTIGNQDFTGPLGMDFDVNADITVTRLGAFDSGSDGLLSEISTRLYDRDSETVLAELSFTPEDPGELVGGSLFKELEPPLKLAAGLRGSIVASGYGPAEFNGNQGSVDLGLAADDGGCAISFVGGGRFGVGLNPDAFPDVVDGGPVNRYAAGTFEFEVDGGPRPVEFSRGEVDQNRRLELTDAVQVLGFLFLGQIGRVPECLDAADADDNGRLELTDGIRILGFLFLGNAPPQPPFDPPGPRCGPDPTVDMLGCLSFVACP